MPSGLWGPNVVSAAAADNELTLAWGADTQSSAVANSATEANSGTQSVRCTYNGVTTGSLMVNNNTEIPVAASTTYVLAWAIRPNASGISVRVIVEWYTAAQAFISDATLATVALTANTWNAYPAQTFTTGASAAFLRVNPQRTAGGTTGDFIYFDTLYVGRLLLGPSSTVVRQAPMRAAVW